MIVIYYNTKYNSLLRHTGSIHIVIVMPFPYLTWNTQYYTRADTKKLDIGIIKIMCTIGVTSNDGIFVIH